MSEKQTSIERVMSTSTGLKRTMSTNAAVMVGKRIDARQVKPQ